MKMSSFRYAPRQGHTKHAKRIYAYLDKTRNMCIQVRTEEPDYSALPDQEFDWEYSVYGEVKKLLPDNAPKTVENYVRLTKYVDANLLHDQLTGRYIKCILNSVNKTLVDWYSKETGTIETATYGSDFVSACTRVKNN